MQSFFVERDRITPQQVIQLYGTQLGHPHLAAHQIVERRHGQRLHTRRLTELDSMLTLLMGARRHGDNDLFNTVVIYPARDTIQFAEDPHAIEHIVLFAYIIIQESHQLPSGVLG